MKNRIAVFICLILTILIGLASRKYDFLFPATLGKYPGDALWAIAVFLSFKILFIKSNPITLGISAIATSFCVEFSQIYHAPWLDSIRSTTLGHLFLGTTFNKIDLISYFTGISIITLIDFYVFHKKTECVGLILLPRCAYLARGMSFWKKRGRDIGSMEKKGWCLK